LQTVLRRINRLEGGIEPEPSLTSAGAGVLAHALGWSASPECPTQYATLAAHCYILNSNMSFKYADQKAF
jgi:hypothetical protein